MTSKKMDAYCKEIRKLESKFYGIENTHVVRDKNKAVDELSKLGSSCQPINQGSRRSRGRETPKPATSSHGSSPDHYGTFLDHSYSPFDH
jgi:hypothetical protein